MYILASLNKLSLKKFSYILFIFIIIYELMSVMFLISISLRSYYYIFTLVLLALFQNMFTQPPDRADLLYNMGCIDLTSTVNARDPRLLGNASNVQEGVKHLFILLKISS